MDDASMAKLKELADMKKSGILTEEEFAQQKAAILAGSGKSAPVEQVAQLVATPVQPITPVQPGQQNFELTTTVAALQSSSFCLIVLGSILIFNPLISIPNLMCGSVFGCGNGATFRVTCSTPRLDSARALPIARPSATSSL